MAKTAGKRAAKVTFYQVVLEGSPKTALGLLAGLQLGSGVEAKFYFCQHEGISTESLGERLAELVRLHPRDCELIVESRLNQQLKRRAKRIAEATGLQLTTSRRIRSGRFDFRFEAFAKRYGDDILKRLHDLPDGARLEGFGTKERISPDAVGIEAYTPAHDYELRGRGRIVGRIDAVIEARRRLQRQPLLQLEPIQLDLA
jgi:hypothetical protein